VSKGVVVLSSFSMELKVWVEGIQRIVCGVTEKTTCQVRETVDLFSTLTFPMHTH
jgi:hypothetical protein